MSKPETLRYRLVDEAHPTPQRVTRCGLPPPSWLTISHALELPALRGVKVMLTVQLAPGAREVPQALISANSTARCIELTFGSRGDPQTSTGGVMRISAIPRGVFPMFVRVTSLGLLGLRTAWPSKLKAPAESFNCVPTPSR